MKKRQENKKIIGFDMDGVILDHTNNKIRAAKKFGILLKKEQTPSVLVKDFFSSLDYKKFKNYFYEEMAETYPPNLMSGVKKVLGLIKRNDIPFYLISRQKYPIRAIGTLKYHNLWPKYFNKQNTFFVAKLEDKELKAKALGITHYIDDEQRVLDVLNSVPNKILFDHLGVFKNPPYRRIKSWEEIAKLV